MACRTGKSFAERANRSGNFSNRSRKFQIARAAGKSFAQVSNHSRNLQIVRAAGESFARHQSPIFKLSFKPAARFSLAPPRVWL
jgi:hypothetical protein